jgi:hypothetical protein
VALNGGNKAEGPSPLLADIASFVLLLFYLSLPWVTDCFFVVAVAALSNGFIWKNIDYPGELEKAYNLEE